MCVKYGARHEQTTAPLKPSLFHKLHGGNKSTRQILNIFLKGDFKHNKTLDNTSTLKWASKHHLQVFMQSLSLCCIPRYHKAKKQHYQCPTPLLWRYLLAIPAPRLIFYVTKTGFYPLWYQTFTLMFIAVWIPTHSKSSMASFIWGQQSAIN